MYKLILNFLELYEIVNLLVIHRMYTYVSVCKLYPYLFTNIDEKSEIRRDNFSRHLKK